MTIHIVYEYLNSNNKIIALQTSLLLYVFHRGVVIKCYIQVSLA